MSEQLNESYARQNESMKEIVDELGRIQGRYMSTATRIIQDNQEIQKQQQQDYQHISDYLKEAEIFCQVLGCLQSDYAEICRDCNAGNGKDFCSKSGRRGCA